MNADAEVRVSRQPLPIRDQVAAALGATRSSQPGSALSDLHGSYILKYIRVNFFPAVEQVVRAGHWDATQAHDAADTAQELVDSAHHVEQRLSRADIRVLRLLRSGAPSLGNARCSPHSESPMVARSSEPSADRCRECRADSALPHGVPLSGAGERRPSHRTQSLCHRARRRFVQTRRAWRRGARSRQETANHAARNTSVARMFEPIPGWVITNHAPSRTRM